MMTKEQTDKMCTQLLESYDIAGRDYRWLENLINQNWDLSKLQQKELVKLYEQHIGFGREDHDNG